VGRNDVRFEAAAAFELARFVAYTVPLETLDTNVRVAYSDPHSVVLTPR
jgi:hypothetical protein